MATSKPKTTLNDLRLKYATRRFQWHETSEEGGFGRFIDYCNNPYVDILKRTERIPTENCTVPRLTRTESDLMARVVHTSQSRNASKILKAKKEWWYKDPVFHHDLLFCETRVNVTIDDIQWEEWQRWLIDLNPDALKPNTVYTVDEMKIAQYIPAQYREFRNIDITSMLNLITQKYKLADRMHTALDVGAVEREKLKTRIQRDRKQIEKWNKFKQMYYKKRGK